MADREPCSGIRRPIVVGVIDSGIDSALMSRVTVARDFTGSADFGVTDSCGHGSAIAQSILANGAGYPVQLAVARVFGDRLTCPVERVVAALDWLVACKVDIINMSFGLRTDYTALRDHCTQALACGINLIAASPAQGESVYPAAYPGVLRATGDARCQQGQLSALHSGQADFGGFAGDPSTDKVVGASRGCASVSGLAARLLSQTKCNTDLVVALTQHAHYQGREYRRVAP